MPLLKFYKYHGTGNDFILVDNRETVFDVANTNLVATMCHRRYGIGADGVILLEKSARSTFFMRYYNRDGHESTMCGNGGRCIVEFAAGLALVQKGVPFEFEAVDGLHEAVWNEGKVNLKMVDVTNVEKIRDGYFVNTGSPHVVCFTDELNRVDVVGKGREIRNSSMFGLKGTNVNFAKVLPGGNLEVRTYERGVEDETWSCGTGCVAAALVSHFLDGSQSRYRVKVLGGELGVSFRNTGPGSYTDVWLEGSAKFVFEGTLSTS